MRINLSVGDAQYRPRTLDDLIIHQEFGESLKKLVAGETFLHPARVPSLR